MRKIYFKKGQKSICGICLIDTVSIVGQTPETVKHPACPAHRLAVGARLTGQPESELELENLGTAEVGARHDDLLAMPA